MITEDNIDTTVSARSCAYDRFICTPEFVNPLSKMSIVATSVQPFKFSQVYELDPDFVKKISDHFPIEMTIEYR